MSPTRLGALLSAFVALMPPAPVVAEEAMSPSIEMPDIRATSDRENQPLDKRLANLEPAPATDHDADTGAAAKNDKARPLADLLTPADQDILRRSTQGASDPKIVIFTSEHRLLYLVDEETAVEFPVGVARRNLKRLGHTRITMKRRDPTWVPTALQHQVYRDLPGAVPPGSPDNPLGTRALNLGIPNIRIHGTNDDEFIGRDLSDGCFRMYNKDIEILFEWVSVGTDVIILQ